MAAKGMSSHRRAIPRGPIVLLSEAICEWFLIFLLFVDAAFSYIIRRYAEYCELPTPCLFCSRIASLYGKRKFECYNDLLCRSHREEISSLVSCHAHGNLADVREMCEECFMSRHGKKNLGSYMVGKLDLEIEQHRVQSFLLHKKISLTSGPRICPCCNRTWGAKPNAYKFLELPPIGCGASKANVKPPLPRVPGRSRFSRRNSFKKQRDRLSAPVSPRSDGKALSDAMSNAYYGELNYTSDTDSEMPFSENRGDFAVGGRKDMNPEHDRHYVARTLLNLQTDDAVSEKQSNHALAEVTPLLDQHVQLESHKSLPTYGLEELNWEEMHLRTNGLVSPVCLEETIEAPLIESGDASQTAESQPHMSSISTLADLIPLKNTHTGCDDKNQETMKSHDEDDMADSQQPITATGISDGDVPCISVGISSTNFSAMTNEEKGEPTTPVALPSASDSPNFEDIKSLLQQSAPKKDDSQDVGAYSPGANHVQDITSPERNSSSLKSVRVNLSGGMTVEQQPINATGFSDGGVPYIVVDISSSNPSPTADDWKEVSVTPVPDGSGSSINFEDIKSVLQQSDPNNDDTQDVGVYSTSTNQMQRLTSLERTDSRFIFERVSSTDDMTLYQQPLNPTCYSDGGVPYILNDNRSTSSSIMADEVKEVSTASIELPSACGSTEFEGIKTVQQSDLKQDGSENVDTSISRVNHVQDLASEERNDFSLKFEERVSINDVEGENSIDVLKSQIEHGKKCMNDLYKELEEERNAASVAANQAMAMITRLQEEKAALHMEALQYLRMMDEQAEYDMEALQRANDDLAEKDKELQDLEYELELCRNNTNGGTSVSGPHKPSISTTGGNATGDSYVHHNGNAKSSMSNLDEEKLYLVEYLKQLERRVHEVSCSKPSVGLSNSRHLELNPNRIDYQDYSLTNDQVESEKALDGSHTQNGFNVVSETSASGREPNIVSLENEIATFRERLQAFEADQEFINHSLRALNNGNEGLEYIQQIIDLLQELRNRMFRNESF